MTVGNNFYEIFDLPVSFDVDLGVLAERYRGVQKVLHPDNYVNSGDRERRLSVQAASRVNDGFAVLRSPLQRAKYLLELRGIDLDKAENRPVDATFLMEQMDLREAMAAARSLAALELIEREIGQSTKRIVDGLRTLFADPEMTNSARIIDLVRKFQFYEKLREQARTRAADLELDSVP